jgi:hypothetical protein
VISFLSWYNQEEKNDPLIFTGTHWEPCGSRRVSDLMNQSSDEVDERGDQADGGTHKHDLCYSFIPSFFFSCFSHIVHLLSIL